MWWRSADRRGTSSRASRVATGASAGSVITAGYISRAVHCDSRVIWAIGSNGAVPRVHGLLRRPSGAVQVAVRDALGKFPLQMGDTGGDNGWHPRLGWIDAWPRLELDLGGSYVLEKLRVGDVDALLLGVEPWLRGVFGVLSFAHGSMLNDTPVP